MDNLEQKVIEAVGYIKSLIAIKPDIGVILGSGLDNLVYEIQDAKEISYSEIPYFTNFAEENKNGKLVFGRIYDKEVVFMSGKLYYHEGYSMQEIVFPIRVFAMLGVEALILANTAGGINPKLKPGDLMLITDHLNLSGDSPLRGKNSDLLGSRFPSMKNCYTPELLEIARKVSYEINVPLQEGIYAFMPGPQYETNAEIKMLSSFGASCVGRSTVPEVIAAAHSGIDVLGITCITNIAGELGEVPTHNEVLEVESKVEENFKALILDTIKKITIETEG